MSPFIVGLGHVAQVGKDTAAAALCRDLGFVKVGFADQLRELAMKADPLVTSSVRTINKDVGHGRYAWVVQGMGYEPAKNTYPEVRRFLQNLGAGAREVFGLDFWIDQAMARARKYERVVIPDVRYLNEAESIHAAGGVLIRIDRPGKVAHGHVSETELAGWDGWDETFVNATDVQALQANVVAFVKNRLELGAAA